MRASLPSVPLPARPQVGPGGSADHVRGGRDVAKGVWRRGAVQDVRVPREGGGQQVLPSVLPQDGQGEQRSACSRERVIKKVCREIEMQELAELVGKKWVWAECHPRCWEEAAMGHTCAARLGASLRAAARRREVKLSEACKTPEHCS